MKKLYFLLIALPALLLVPSTTQAKRLQAFMSYATFCSPTDGPYIETYTTVVGKSVVFVQKPNGKWQGTIELTLIFKQDSVVRDFKKINLLSPELDDTTNVNINFIDQQRFLLPNGTYKVEISISDKNDKAIPYNSDETITIDYPAGKAAVSGIEFIESIRASQTTTVLSKSGYDLVPYILNYFPESVSKLTFYAEVNNADKIVGENQKYLLSSFIETYETNQLYGEYIKVKKETAKQVNVLINEFDISLLPTGNYNLVIEVRNQKNEIVASNKLFFRRNNPEYQPAENDLSQVKTVNSFVEKITSADTLKDWIKCLFPISSESERSYARIQIKKNDLSSMKQYFLFFWQARDVQNPEKAWLTYYQEVQKVNNDFGTPIKKGYATDRGRVYLQYGPPNSRIQVLDDPDAYPYEIWHYHSLANQQNKRFVYYNRDLISNDYELIQSDAKGEVSDYRWKLKIYSRNSVTTDIDSDAYIPHYGSKIDDYYNNPR